MEDLLSCYGGRPSCVAGDLLGEVKYLVAAAREVRAFLGTGRRSQSSWDTDSWRRRESEGWKVIGQGVKAKL